MLSKVAAFLIRDFRVEISYPMAFLWRWGSILFNLVIFYFLGRLVGAAAAPYLAPYGGQYFPFAVVGLALAAFQEVGLMAVSQTISYGMYTGTLEVMLLSPTSLSTIIFSSVLYQFFSALITILVYLAFSVGFFGVSLGQTNLAAAMVLLFLALTAHLPLGILSASFMLVFKRGDPLTMMLGQLTILLGGVYFPVQVLPLWLQAVSWFIPFTHALEGLRQAVLMGRGLAALLPQITVLLAFTLVLMPLSLAAFAWAIRQAKRLGTLSQF
jgi:ABC-2 type transport system permease protein